MKYCLVKLSCALLLLTSMMACSNHEPPFVLKGDPALTQDIKVNIELIKDTSSTMATAYYNGKSYALDNQNVLRYVIYISYKDSLFYRAEMDNLHGKVSGEVRNEILITRKGDAVMATYNPFQTDTPNAAGALLPASLFFVNAIQKAAEKDWYTGLFTADNKAAQTVSLPAAAQKTGLKPINNCEPGESFIFGADDFKSYTEDQMRGQGIISFQMDKYDRLTILNMDDTYFGEIVLGQDGSYFTLTLPKRIVARRLITSFDYANYDFDAEKVSADKDYLFIYVNKKKRKVKKADLKYTFSTWPDYIKAQSLLLKDCNLLTDAQGKPNPKSKGLAFDVTEINGDEIKIKSTKDCLGEDGPYLDLQGKVKWRLGDKLLVDFALCI